MMQRHAMSELPHPKRGKKGVQVVIHKQRQQSFHRRLRYFLTLCTEVL